MTAEEKRQKQSEKNRRYYAANQNKIQARKKSVRALDPESARRRERERSQKRPEQKSEVYLRYRKNNMPKILARHREQNYKRGGSDWTSKAFEEAWIRQAGTCAICRRKMEKGVTTKEKATADHDHDTGKSRDLICHCCNAGLGHFEDSQSLLQLAVAYLNRHGRIDTFSPENGFMKKSQCKPKNNADPFLPFCGPLDEERKR